MGKVTRALHLMLVCLPNCQQEDEGWATQLLLLLVIVADSPAFRPLICRAEYTTFLSPSHFPWDKLNYLLNRRRWISLFVDIVRVAPLRLKLLAFRLLRLILPDMEPAVVNKSQTEKGVIEFFFELIGVGYEAASELSGVAIKKVLFASSLCTALCCMKKKKKETDHFSGKGHGQHKSRRGCDRGGSYHAHSTVAFAVSMERVHTRCDTSTMAFGAFLEMLKSFQELMRSAMGKIPALVAVKPQRTSRTQLLTDQVRVLNSRACAHADCAILFFYLLVSPTVRLKFGMRLLLCVFWAGISKL